MISRYKTSTTYSILALALAVIFGVTSCDESSTGVEKPDPPQLPSAEVMQPGMETFSNNNPSSSNSKSIANADYSNFTRASVVALGYSGILSANAAVPAALLGAASNSEPEFNGDGSWSWIYDYGMSGNSYQVVLNAEVDVADQAVDWEMLVSVDAGNTSFEDQRYLSGSSAVQGNSGHWYLYLPDGTAATDTVAKTNYTYSDTANYSMSMQFLRDGADHRQDSLNFERAGNIKQLNYVDFSDDQSVEIRWNMETGAGYIIDPRYNGGAKACWDESFMNTTCSQ